MSPRARVLTFGSAALLMVAASVVGVVFSGVVGEAFAIALGSLGLIAFLSLIFYEVGLSEDRERAQAAAPRRRADPSRAPRRIPRRPRRPT
jgi:hypothetical protein